MLPHAIAMGAPEEPERIAGLLRLEPGPGGSSEVHLVIDPRFRSIGITTLLVEQVGLDTTGEHGWLGSGAARLSAWARGNHPASGRLSNRFLIPRTRRIWKLIRPTDSAHHPAAPVLEAVTGASLEHLDWAAPIAHGDNLFALREGATVTGVVSLDLTAMESAEFGRCATLAHLATSAAGDPASLQRLLDSAAAVAHDAGFTGLITYVDSGDRRLVNACRLVGFQHDRTDVRYELGDPR
jgi:mycothiol synthase